MKMLRNQTKKGKRSYQRFLDTLGENAVFALDLIVLCLNIYLGQFCVV